MERNSDKLCTLEEAGRILQVSPFTVRRWLKEKRLSGIRVGRRWLISKDEINRLTAASNVTTPVWKDSLAPDEAEAIVIEIVSVLEMAGPSVNKAGVRQLVMGEQPIDADFWRALKCGIQHLKLDSQREISMQRKEGSQ